jgi:prepilin peptidase CpaA
MSLETVSQLILAIFVVACIVIDIRTTKIPNLITFPVAALGLVLNYFQHGWHGVGQGALGWLLAAAITVVIGNLPIGSYAGGGIGMGDAKMLAAIGAFLGPKKVMIVFLYFCLCFGAMSMAFMLRTVPWRQVISATRAIAFGADPDAITIDTTKLQEQRKALIPISVAIGVATLLGQLLMQPTLTFLGFS